MGEAVAMPSSLGDEPDNLSGLLEVDVSTRVRKPVRNDQIAILAWLVVWIAQNAPVGLPVDGTSGVVAQSRYRAWSAAAGALPRNSGSALLIRRQRLHCCRSIGSYGEQRSPDIRQTLRPAFLCSAFLWGSACIFPGQGRRATTTLDAVAPYF
jgi:hypothetical protein